MNENIDIALKFTLAPFIEGGYVNDPNDPGGETKYGICKRDHPTVDIKNLTIDGAKAIYRSEYWNTAGCDNIPFPMDIVAFDIAVNQGVGRAKEVYANAANWEDALILRLDRWDDLKKLFARYGTGWAKRLVSLRDYIISDFTVFEHDRKELVSGKNSKYVF